MEMICEYPIGHFPEGDQLTIEGLTVLQSTEHTSLHPSTKDANKEDGPEKIGNGDNDHEEVDEVLVELVRLQDELRQVTKSNEQVFVSIRDKVI